MGRAVEKDETLGLMMIFGEAETDEILGGTILGTGGDEAIHCLIDLMASRSTATAFRRINHAHPSHRR